MPFARKAAVVLGAAAWWLMSCREVPAPKDGIFALSPVILPSPGLVVGDTMRDSTGLAAPLRVVAFNVAGDTVNNAPVTFVRLDTLGAHFAGAFMVGDTAGFTVRVVGSVNELQTQPAQVKVTLSPDTLAPADSTRHTKTFSLISGDTVVNSADLAVNVLHRGTSLSGVDAVIVRYTIVRAPAGSGSGPAIVLVNGNIPSSRDTTEGGRAARAARLRLAAITTTAADTAVIDATASYRGRTLGTVQFTVIFKSQ